MNILRFTVCTLAFVLAPAVAWSADLTPSQDNTIFQNSTTVSGGGEIGIFVGANASANPARRGLIQFDVAGGLPAGVTIVDASLTLTLEMANNATARTISLYRLNSPWGEGAAGAGMALNGSGYPVADGDATWTEAKHNQVNWTAGGDIITPASAALSVAGNTVNTTYTWTSAGLLNDVKDWYANPATNFGWDLVNSDEAITQSVKVFYSREFTTTPGFRPKLTITYVPEPTAVVLALMASPLLLLRGGRKN
jgi:hypothetical protein